MLAAVVRLLDTGYIRVGNEQYARDNKSFGATTLRTRHLRRKGSKMLMRFTGKHGIVHELTLTDSHLKRVVGSCQELPGQMLFQYVERRRRAASRSPRATSTIISARRMGGDFTAKHFRTWGASVIAMEQLLKKAEDARITVKTMIEPVAEALGNTEAMSRKAYVHPRADRGGQGRSARSARRAWSGRAPQAAVVDRGRADRISLASGAAAAQGLTLERRGLAQGPPCKPTSRPDPA